MATDDNLLYGLSLTGLPTGLPPHLQVATPALLGLRLRRVQKLISSAGLDGLLLIAGLDGRYNTGTHQALAYLLEGRSGRDVLDVTGLQPAVEEAVLLVRPHGLAAYTAPPAGHEGEESEALEALRDLLPRLRCGALESFAPTAAEVDDPDELEEAKVGAFVAMLRGLHKLGVAVGSTNAPPAAGAAPPRIAPGPALMELERWPLAQAYGLEGVARGGFFTMNHELYDVHAALQPLYGVLDSRQLQQLLAENAMALSQHWLEALCGLGTRVAAGTAAELTERQVVEPLLGYFTYGLLRPVPGVEQAMTMPPRCVAGVRTGEEAAKAEPQTLGNAELSEPAGAGSHPAVHMVLEGADARSALRVARTYFLSLGCLTSNAFADLEEEREEGYSFETATVAWGGGEDALYLMRLYCALVSAARAAMVHFAMQDGATVHTARQVALDMLATAADRQGVPLPGPPTQCVRFALWQCDHANNIKGMAERGSPYLKVVRLSLLGITSRPAGGGPLLGGLVYADTFIDVPCTATQPASLLVLTDAVPPLLAFSALGAEAAAALRASLSFARFAAEAAEALAYSAAGGAGGPAAAAGAAARRRQRAAEASAAAAAKPKRKSARPASATSASRSNSEVNGGAPGGSDDEEPESTVDEEEDEEESEEEEDGAAAAAVADVAAERPTAAQRLGALLSVGGGDEVVLLTGCEAAPSLPGTLHCMEGGFAFTHATTKAVWLVNFATDVEGITIQGLPGPSGRTPRTSDAAAAGALSPRGAGGPAATLGDAVVFRGRRPACGVPPVCHLTADLHLALPLASMSPGGRKALLTAVLPAWSRSARAAGMTYTKDPWMANPLPWRLFAAHAHAVMSGGGRKAWPASHLTDAAVEEAVDRFDAIELAGSLSQFPPAVEALLQRGPAGGSVAVTLVLGAPGADHSRVTSCISGMLGDNSPGSATSHRVVLLPPGGLAATSLSPADLDSALAAAAGTAGELACSHVVLSSACFDGTVTQLAALAASKAGRAGRLHVATVVACVNVEGAMEDRARGRLAPGLLELLAPGCVDVVVLNGAHDGGDKLAQVQALVQQCCPGASVLRGRLQLSRARGELLPDAAERAARLAQPAAVALRRCWAPAPAATVPRRLAHGPLQVLRVAWEGVLDVTKLRAQLASAGLLEAPSAAVPSLKLDLQELPLDSLPQYLLGAVGVLRLAAGAPAVELIAARDVALRQHDCALAGLPICHGAPSALGDTSRVGGELAFVGTGLRPAALAALVTASKYTLPLQAAVRTVQSLTTSERAAVALAHRLDPLPNGCYFDGTQFLDEFGDRSPYHPELPTFLLQLVERLNSGVADAAAQHAAAVAGGREQLTILKAELC